MKRFIVGTCLLAAILQAEPRTFTDQLGRTVSAELISVEGDQIRIRRDDGQTFTLSVSKLTKDDQKFIREWQGAQPAPTPKAEEKFTPDPKKLAVTISRGKFATQTLALYEGYSHKHENWGYSIQIANQHLKSVEKLRIEYNLFARTYPDTSTPTMITGSKELATIRSGGSEVFRTSTAEVCKRRDMFFGNTAGEMRGIWVRIYIDDQLIIEQSSPETLLKNEKWTKVTDNK